MIRASKNSPPRLHRNDQIDAGYLIELSALPLLSDLGVEQPARESFRSWTPSVRFNYLTLQPFNLLTL